MTLQNDFPALKSCSYFNTAYVGLMSQSLYQFRTEFEQNYLNDGDQYKINAYNQLDETHATIAQFIGSNEQHTFFVSNFSVGIRYVLDGLKKGSNILYVNEDYHSLVDAINERDFNFFQLTIAEDLEQRIENALANQSIDALIISIVQYTNGLKIDFDFLQNLRDKYPQLLIVGDATQFIGTDYFNFNDSPFDAVVCSGYKWLLAGFGNGFVALSDRFFEMATINRDDFYQRVFAGHFNILGAASLVFAMNYLISNDYKQLVERNKMLAATLKKELHLVGNTSEFYERSQQSSIVSIPASEELYNRLEDSNIRTAIRGKYLRFSLHFYNSIEEIEQLVNILKKEAQY